MQPPIRFSFALLLLFLTGCGSSRQTLAVHSLPNYDAKSVHHVLFLDFIISRPEPGKSEQLSLTNSIVGNGEMKSLGTPAHSPIQIHTVRYYTDNRPPEKDSLDHPLFRSIESSGADGSLSRTLTTDQSGHFSVRFPYVQALKMIRVYSTTPDSGRQELYTLRLKP